MPPGREFVERKTMGRLGTDPSAPYVASRRTNQEKEPWKSLPGIENRVEAEFLRPVLLGESILPYRLFQPFEAVVPVTDKGEVLDSDAASNRGFDGLHGWMSKAEKVWNAHKRSDMKLAELFDYFAQLSSQFPLAPLRAVYAASGTNPAACILKEPAVIEHKLYWSAPIPRFDANNFLHNDIAKTAREAEALAASVPLPENVKFQRARGLVRAALTDAGVAQRIDALVARLLDGV